MENLSHTLFGLVLSKAGLEEASPLATTALVISSNLPDLDALFGLKGGSLYYIKYHRGITHSFAGIAVIAAILTLVLIYVDRRLRLRRDPFFRPARPGRIFWISLLGGLGHLALDFTNNYGVRPLTPFNGRWFYGDLIFIADPWIWLILGAAAVWVTTAVRNRSGRRTNMIVIWLGVGLIGSAAVLFAPIFSNGALDVTGWFQQPSRVRDLLSTGTRIVWFAGIAVIAAGTILRWGGRPRRVAQISLLILCVYYGAVWVARQQAIQDAASIKPAPEARLAVWAQPANPRLWKSDAAANGSIYTQNIGLLSWLPVSQPAFSPDGWNQHSALEPRFEAALRTDPTGRIFLDFARFPIANINELADGFSVDLRDSRFNLQLHATLDHSMNVTSSNVTWF